MCTKEVRCGVYRDRLHNMHDVFCLEFCVWDTVTRSSREFLVITFSPQSKVYLFSKTYWFIDIRKSLMIKLLQIQSNLLKVIYCVLTHLFCNLHYHNGSFRSCSVKLNSSHMNCFGIGKPWVDLLVNCFGIGKPWVDIL